MLVTRINSLQSLARYAIHRNFGCAAVVTQKATDPIQKLFVEKVKEYSQKRSSSGGKLVEATPEVEKALRDELLRIEKQYGVNKGDDLTKFPTFKYNDPKIDPINMETK